MASNKNTSGDSQQILFGQAQSQLQELATDESRCLFFADENCTPQHLPGWFQDSQHLAISNRFDIYQALQNGSINSVFNDFELAPEQGAAFDLVLIRVSKEKLVNSHLLNQAYLALKPHGRLLLIGAKNEGIKSIDKLAQNLFGKACEKQKFKPQIELLMFEKSADVNAELADIAYADLVKIDSLAPALKKVSGNTSRDFSSCISSKPGVFGWQKIDLASLLLIDCGLDYLEQQNLKPKSLLDLGAGSGLLAMAFGEQLKPQLLCATDNNAAAMQACQKNLQQLQPHCDSVNILAGDCGDTIQTELGEKFDLIVCNPPFHQGFSVSGDLSAKFMQRIKSSLKKDGLCLLVANQFVAYERLAAENKLGCQELKREQGFKILVLQPEA